MYLSSKVSNHVLMGLLALSLSIPVFANGSTHSYASQPNSHSGWYAGVHGGAALYNGATGDATNTGFDGGAQIGYQFSPFRVEGEVTYYRNGLKGVPSDIHLNLLTLMGNVYYDFFTGTRLTPYVGGGVGWMHPTLTSDTATVSGDDKFAYQGIVGADYALNQQWSIGAAYHILGYNGNSGDYNHSVNAVLTYHFA